MGRHRLERQRERHGESEWAVAVHHHVAATQCVQCPLLSPDSLHIWDRVVESIMHPAADVDLARTARPQNNPHHHLTQARHPHSTRQQTNWTGSRTTLPRYVNLPTHPSSTT